MLKTLILCASVICVADARAQDFGGYVGASVGYSFLRAQDGDGLATDYSLTVGATFTPELSAELEYKRSGSFIAVSSEGLSDFETTNVSLFGRYTFDPQASGAFVRAGVSTVSIEQTMHGELSEETGTGLALGIGMQFELIEYVYARPEITVYQYPDLASGSATFGEISIGLGLQF
ncbi:MAG: porin family protein [Pseudomonadota bacterium]